MCVIIHRQAGKQIDEDVLEACLNANSDGFGVAWHDGGVVRTTRGLVGLEKVLEKEKQTRQFDCLFHFRWTTHGKTSNENCHPFRVGKNRAAFVHNGVFSEVDLHKPDWSDTRSVARYFNDAEEETLRHNIKEGVIENWHGWGNRTGFIFSNGEIMTTGTWSKFDGASFSNLNWQHGLHRKRDHKITDRRGFLAGSGCETRDSSVLSARGYDTGATYHPKKTQGYLPYATSAEGQLGQEASNRYARDARGTTGQQIIANGPCGARESKIQRVEIEIKDAPDRLGKHLFTVTRITDSGVSVTQVVRGYLQDHMASWKMSEIEPVLSYLDEETAYKCKLYEQEFANSFSSCC